MLKPFNVRGLEPVAIIKFLGMSISFSEPSSNSTETVPAVGEKIDGPKIVPVPTNKSIFPCLNNW